MSNTARDANAKIKKTIILIIRKLKSQLEEIFLDRTKCCYIFRI